jgi:hypothetical protein
VNPHKLRRLRQKAANANQPPATPAISSTPPSVGTLINRAEDAFATCRHFVGEMLLGREHVVYCSSVPGVGKTTRFQQSCEWFTRAEEIGWKLARNADGTWPDERLTRFDEHGNFTFGPRWTRIEDGEPVFHARWFIVSAHCTPIYLHAYAHEFSERGELIIGDDLPVARTGPGYAQLLQLLDDKPVRWMSWQSMRNLPTVPWRSESPPSRYQTRGGMAFLGNTPVEKLPPALTNRLTNAVRVPVETRDDILQWCRHMAHNGALAGHSNAEIADALRYLTDEIYPAPKRSLSLRTLVAACRMRQREPENWRRLAAYAF